MSTPDTDPFDTLLNLEQTYYNDGYAAGVADGERAGLIEGRIFGLEKGFEKYMRMGRLHGKAVVWAGRLPSEPDKETRAKDDNDHPHHHHRYDVYPTQTPGPKPSQQDDHTGPPPPNSEEKQVPPSETTTPSTTSHNPLLPDNRRLEKHVRTLYALVEPSSLSTLNSEEAVADFDDRLKRAEGKVKVIEKLVGESRDGQMMMMMMGDDGEKGDMNVRKSSGDDSGSIEDIGSLRVRALKR
jgi:hypothetical protein